MAKKAGRPKTQIDWDEFDKLCQLQCTQKEIASWFNCTDDTIQNRCKAEKGVDFSEYYAQKAEGGKISLRRIQFQLAHKNVAMAIWLGKQWLGQSEKQHVVNENINHDAVVSETDLEERISLLKKK